MAAPLLATKFYIPPTGPGRLHRPRLLQILDEGLLPGRPLILVCAPAGYGKTTLLSEWAAARSTAALQFVWLSLETADNDPVRFFTYLSAALQKVIPGIARLIEDLLAAPQLPSPNDLAAALVNPLAGCDQPLVIVLDDYQVIHESNLHTALLFLIEHLPPHIHLALAARSDPPLPLPRLRVRGQLVELRLNELRFDRSETEELLAQAVETQLNEEQLTLLEERTEGWAAGLRMVLLSIHGKDNLDQVLHNLSGSRRYILDYLAEEALQNQSADLQSFLLHTAILERLCAPLCNTLTGQSSGQEMLQALEKANCFLIPLDEDGTWFRYHHLFADLLRVRLKQHAQRQTGLIETLHSRAAAWLAENNFSEEAVHHSLLANDFASAARIVEQSTVDLLAHGRMHQLLSWIRLLSEAQAAQRPWLNISQAWTLAFAARLPEAEQHLVRAETGLVDGSFDALEQARMRAEICAIRSLLALTSGSIPAALALTELPEDIVPPEAGFARSVQRWAVGYALRMKGDLAGAERAFEEVLRIGYELNNLWTINTASVDLGAILRQRGDLRRAETIYRTGLARSYQAVGGPGYIGRLEAFLANLLMERGALQEAGGLIKQAIAHNQRWENPNHCAYTWMVKARFDLLNNQLNDAAAALAEADAWMAKGPIVMPLVVAVELMRVRFWLRTGELEKAKDWLSHQKIPVLAPGMPLSEIDEVLRSAAVRIHLATGRLSEARELLAPSEAAARHSGKFGALVEILVLQACAAPDPASTAAALRDALELGLPRGFHQVFLDEGRRLMPALESCQDISGVSSLLADLRSKEPPAAAEGPLTAREVEILRWVASGLSNPEIGARLYISAGTVKAHTAAIYRKLDVANRAEAIARAKDLGLL